MICWRLLKKGYIRLVRSFLPKGLMEQYNVSRITSKKALEMLADRNIIVRMPGKGSFVLEENEQDRENLPAVPQTVEPVRKGKMLGVILDFSVVFRV